MFEIDIKNKLINLIAKRNSGKSYLLRYLVRNQKNEFAKIFVICPTNLVNNFYKDITNEESIFSEYNEKWTQELINRMTELNSKLDKSKRKNVLYESFASKPIPATGNKNVAAVRRFFLCTVGLKLLKLVMIYK